MHSDKRKFSPPIKIVDKTINTPVEVVVNGNGISASIPAMPHFKDWKREQLKQGWSCLLHYCSDGDLVLIKKREIRNIPTNKRHVPLSWKTSNGTFKTTKVRLWI